MTSNLVDSVFDVASKKKHKINSVSESYTVHTNWSVYNVFLFLECMKWISMNVRMKNSMTICCQSSQFIMLQSVTPTLISGFLKFSWNWSSNSLKRRSRGVHCRARWNIRSGCWAQATVCRIHCGRSCQVDYKPTWELSCQCESERSEWTTCGRHRFRWLRQGSRQVSVCSCHIQVSFPCYSSQWVIDDLQSYWRDVGIWATLKKHFEPQCV